MQVYSPRNRHTANSLAGFGRKRKSLFAKWVKGIFLLAFFLLLGGLLFLKLNLSAAAIFTDNVLRPLLGDANVIAIEKIFFNASDGIQRLTSNQNSIKAPQFEDSGGLNNVSGSNLDLSPIPKLNNFEDVQNEGIWRDWPLKAFPDKEVMAYTFVRSDQERAYSITTLVQLDMSVLGIGSVAGIKQPAGPIGKPGPGKVPKEIVDSGNLVAAFDGGFQYKDGQYGMIVGDKTYLPLKNDLGTFIAYKDGTLKIVDYQGQELGGNINFIRQNCPMLISNGEITVTNPRSRILWGRLAAGTVDIYTYRSGIGLTKKGNLIFAAGNNLTPNTLAIALKSAGAVNAIQLDINPIWVRFNIFDQFSQGKYVSTPLTKELHDGTDGYLNGYDKDFFYVYKK